MLVLGCAVYGGGTKQFWLLLQEEVRLVVEKEVAGHGGNHR